MVKDCEAPDNHSKGFDEFMASAETYAAAKLEAEEPAGFETNTKAEFHHQALVSCSLTFHIWPKG